MGAQRMIKHVRTQGAGVSLAKAGDPVSLVKAGVRPTLGGVVCQPSECGLGTVEAFERRHPDLSDNDPDTLRLFFAHVYGTLGVAPLGLSEGEFI